MIIQSCICLYTSGNPGVDRPWKKRKKTPLSWESLWKSHDFPLSRCSTFCLVRSRLIPWMRGKHGWFGGFYPGFYGNGMNIHGNMGIRLVLKRDIGISWKCFMGIYNNHSWYLGQTWLANSPTGAFDGMFVNGGCSPMGSKWNGLTCCGSHHHKMAVLVKIIANQIWGSGWWMFPDQ